MTLTDTLEKIKIWLMEKRDVPKDIFVFFAILLVAVGSFFIGRISVQEDARKAELKIFAPRELTANAGNAIIPPISQESMGISTTSDTTLVSTGKGVTSVKKQKVYVGSINGRVYHLPACPGAMRIKKENMIWFETKVEAEAIGYKPAGNCKGL